MNVQILFVAKVLIYAASRNPRFGDYVCKACGVNVSLGKLAYGRLKNTASFFVRKI